MTLTLTILGCGSSGGVPRPVAGWGACDPHNPKNRRRRCSILLEKMGPNGQTVVIIDTPPDHREQVLSAGVERLDAVLLTHEHADHLHGIDDVRPAVMHMRRLMPVYMDTRTSTVVRERFGYCFETPIGSDYPPITHAMRITKGHEIVVEGPGGVIKAMPFEVHHGDIDALGFRFGKVAYTPDLHAIPGESLEVLRGLDVWIIDALRHRPHPSHLTVAEALEWIDRMKPKRAILTNLHFDLDYETLKATLPDHIEPAFDGMKLVLEGV
ncbi:MAG: MBL fold metallo-hydrolase [Alphaproteobacteria bacterium]|nr:MBL fold metallo-hydrolase [Alphaproteobacteria bacterium]